jgi:hypothetical protein
VFELKKVLYTLKFIAIIVSIFFVAYLAFAIYIFSPHSKEVDSNTLIEKPVFQSLHNSILKLDSIKNIAVLPDANYIVLNGLVINLAKKTYGKEPELTFYAEYYTNGDSILFNSLNKLLIRNKFKIDSLKTMYIVEKMKATEISDILVKNGKIEYRWNVSAMYGQEGIIYSKTKVDKNTGNFDLIEKLDKEFYHFAIY